MADEAQRAMQQQIANLQEQLDQQREQRQQPEPQQHIARIAIKPVPFFKDEPDLYFIQLEAQFSNASITTDQTKYNHAIANFDPKYLQKVTDLLRSPPADNKYTTFKTRILKEFSDSQDRKFHRLIQDCVLGDDKPSQLLKRMKDLANNAINDDALKSMWIQRLPESVRAVISVAPGDATQWAELADKMMEVTNFPTIAAVKNPLFDEIAALRKEIAELRSEHRSRKETKHDEKKDRSRSKSKSQIGFCYFHHRFGSNARKCNDPCTFDKKRATTEKSEN